MPQKGSKMKKAVIVKTTGEKSVVEFNNETSYSVLSGAVGGYIQPVWLPSRKVEMWVHEEGKLIGLEQNPYGTALWVEAYGLTDVVVGDIILTGGTDHNGYTLGLKQAQVDDLLAYEGFTVVL
jgi:Domain of unknown function (DUF3846)